VSFDWALGDGTFANGAIVSHTYLSPGIYPAVVTASNNVSLLTATTIVRVDEVIVGLSAINDSPTPEGAPTTLTATVTAGSNITYTWSFGDGILGSGVVVSHTYPAVGTYTAAVTASNSVSWLTATTMVVITDSPVIGLNAFNDSPTALGQPTHLTATVFAGSNVSYTWDFGDGNLGIGETVTHTYSAAGVYIAMVTASNTFNLLTATTIVTVEEAITGLVAFNDSPTQEGNTTTVTATVTTGSNITYAWAFGDGAFGSGPILTHTYPAVGVYTAVVTATNSVSLMSAVTTVRIVPVEFKFYLPLILKRHGPP
jgi:PKD repeat protein